MNRLFDYGQRILLGVCIGMSVLYGYGLAVVWALQDRAITMCVAVVFFSPVMMFILRLIELKGRFKRSLGIFNPRKQSWAFMFGDTFLLSYAMIFLTRGWQSVPSDSVFHSMEWAVMSLVLGCLLSVAFRMFDRKRYIKAGVKDALYTLTKLWHDFGVFPVLLSLLLFMGLPQLFLARSGDTVVGSLAVLGFIALCAADGMRDKRGTLNAADQHFVTA
jgi:hypothetical protein